MRQTVAYGRAGAERLTALAADIGRRYDGNQSRASAA
jgi:hypothetical protein